MAATADAEISPKPKNKWSESNSVWYSRQFSVILLVSQLVFIVLFGFLTEYDPAVQPTFSTGHIGLHHHINHSASESHPHTTATLPLHSHTNSSGEATDKFTKIYPSE